MNGKAVTRSGVAMESYLAIDFPHLPESSHPETSPVKETQAVFKALKLSVSKPLSQVCICMYVIQCNLVLIFSEIPLKPGILRHRQPKGVRRLTPINKDSL